MQPAQLIRYMENPRLLTKESMAELQQLVKDFPYFQPAHVLLSLASKQWDASVYQQSLKKTAIVVSNRTHLFQLIRHLETALPLEEKEKQKEKEVIETTSKQEEVKQELDILKAAELTVDQAREENLSNQKQAPAPEEVLEKEIEKQVVSSFVEKEILKTPELHHPKKEEPESFVEWLNLLKKNNGQSYEQIHEQVSSERARQLKPKEEKPAKEPENQSGKREKHKAIIDKIIEKNPGMIRNKEDQKFFAAETRAKESLLENEHLVTETLAKIYALQGSVNKAIRAYEILSLKYPQKSAYFANLIQKLKTNQ